MCTSKTVITPETLTAAGAKCEVTSPVGLHVDLPVDATSTLVFHSARDAGIQVRSIGVRRETVEAGFLRVIGEAPAENP